MGNPDFPGGYTEGRTCSTAGFKLCFILVFNRIRAR